MYSSSDEQFRLNEPLVLMYIFKEYWIKAVKIVELSESDHGMIKT